jgi:mono/diheme cytochrome c family protein
MELIRVLAVLAALAAGRVQEKPGPGQAAFARVCEPCHGPQGNGAGQGPALVPYSRELSELVAIVRSGLGLMPAIPKAEITDEEISQVHAYLKELTSKSGRARR